MSLSPEKEIFKKSRPVFSRLEDNGFCRHGEKYIHEEILPSSGMKAVVEVRIDGTVSGRVIDTESDDEYTAFRVEGVTGKFANTVKEEYAALLLGIRQKCFTDLDFIFDQSNRVAALIRERYGAEPEFLWKNAPGFGVFRNRRSGKWFGIIMDIDRSKLAEDEEEETEILNVKLDDLTEEYAGRPGIYRAYHMNKKSWVSVTLDDTLADEEIEELLDMSFAASDCASRRDAQRPGRWLIPANPQYYDIIAAFDETDTVNWKQSSRVMPGDIVYIYVGAPVSAILYKCEATEVNIPYRYRDENIHMEQAMMLKLIKKYDRDRFTRGRMAEFGVRGVRGPRGVPEELAAALDSE